MYFRIEVMNLLLTIAQFRASVAKRFPGRVEWESARPSVTRLNVLLVQLIGVGAVLE